MVNVISYASNRRREPSVWPGCLIIIWGFKFAAPIPCFTTTSVSTSITSCLEIISYLSSSVFDLCVNDDLTCLFLYHRDSCIFGSGIDFDPVLLFWRILHGTDIEVLDYYCERIIPVDTSSSVLDEFTCTFFTAVTQWLFVLI